MGASIGIQSARQGLANSSVNPSRPNNSSEQAAEKTLNFQLESDKIDLSAKAVLMARQLQNEENNVSRASQAAAGLAEFRDKIFHAARISENAYWVNEDIRVVPTFQGYALGQMLTSPDSGNFMVEMYWEGSQSKNSSNAPADLGAVHPTQSERDEYFGILHRLYNEICGLKAGLDFVEAQNFVRHEAVPQLLQALRLFQNLPFRHPLFQSPYQEQGEASRLQSLQFVS